MKKMLILAAAAWAVAAAVPARAGNDRPIAVGELPEVSRTFLHDHFPEVEVSYAKVDAEFFSRDYTVVFVDGSKVEFSGDGAWREVACKYGEVPAAVVPEPIVRYVAGMFPGRKIVSIDRDRRDYELELDNGLDLKFDLKYRLVEMDD